MGMAYRVTGHGLSLKRHRLEYKGDQFHEESPQGDDRVWQPCLPLAVTGASLHFVAGG